MNKNFDRSTLYKVISQYSEKFPVFYYSITSINTADYEDLTA